MAQRIDGATSLADIVRPSYRQPKDAHPSTIIPDCGDVCMRRNACLRDHVIRRERTRLFLHWWATRLLQPKSTHAGFYKYAYAHTSPAATIQATRHFFISAATSVTRCGRSSSTLKGRQQLALQTFIAHDTRYFNRYDCCRHTKRVWKRKYSSHRGRARCVGHHGPGLCPATAGRWSNSSNYCARHITHAEISKKISKTYNG